MTARAALLVLLAAGLAGCGGGGGGDAARPPVGHDRLPPPEPPPADTRRADPLAVRAIRGWVDAERLSRMGRAAAWFSLPAIVLNGGEPLVLRSRSAVREWNAALPCGAALMRAVDVRGWTVARFRLTDRSGSYCDDHGGTASTAFALRRGRIALWIRVRDDVPPQRAAPPHPPERDFLVRGRLGGRRVPVIRDGGPQA
jgi:hypothetical protein